MDLIGPSDNLRFHLQEDKYKRSLGFELGKVHNKKSFNVVINKVFNFGILQSKKNKTIGEKIPMTLELIDTIRILGIQDKDHDSLNPINISVSSDTVIQELTKYRKYRYRIVLESLLFSLNIENETDVNFVSCDGLANVKEALINSKLGRVLGVCYLNEWKNWELIKGQSKRSQAIFTDSEFQNKPSHFAFAFLTRSISDMLNFKVTLLNGDGNKIKFPVNEKKTLVISFKIQIVR